MSEPKKSFNVWPYAIFGGYGLFACIMIGTVIVLSRERVDLVTPEYYANQIKYEAHLDATRAAARPGYAFLIGEIKDGVVRLVRPSAVTEPLSGTATLYRPSDKDKDVSRPIELGEDGGMNLAVAGLQPGVWRLKLEWEVAKTAHYQEVDLFLP